MYMFLEFRNILNSFLFDRKCDVTLQLGQVSLSRKASVYSRFRHKKNFFVQNSEISLQASRKQFNNPKQQSSTGQLYFSLSLSLSLSFSFFLFLCLSVFLSFCLSVFRSLCLSFTLSLYVFLPLCNLHLKPKLCRIW